LVYHKKRKQKHQLKREKEQQVLGYSQLYMDFFLFYSVTVFFIFVRAVRSLYLCDINYV